jgi:hypothetical protein
MNTQATPIRLSEAHAGMVLAMDLCDAGGTVLLPAGTALSDASLASLGRRGIDEVSVVAEEPVMTDAQLEAERQRRCARLERLFRHSAGIEATDELLGYLMRYRKGDARGHGH